MKDFAFRSKPIVFQRTPPQRRSRHVPEAVVSAPRDVRVTSQRRSCLLPETFTSRPRGGRVCSQRRSRHVPEAVASAPRFADRHRGSAVGMQFS